MTNPIWNVIMVIVGLTLLFSTFLISNDNIAHSQPSSKKPTIHGVLIQNPGVDDKVSTENNNFTITGRSVDNQSSGCQILVIINDVKPYQKASAIGIHGSDDFSQWKYDLSPDYTKLKIGKNKITAKIDCKNPPDLLRYDTINIMGTKPFNLKEVETNPNTGDISVLQNNDSLKAGNLLMKRPIKSQDLENTTINDNKLAQSDFNTSTSRVDRFTTDAQNIYSDKKMIIPSSVKYLIILIPNEGHESINQPKNQLPLINQPYVPQNVIIDKNTSIIWVNADVGHRHKITLNDSNSEKIFESKFIKYNTTSNSIKFNETGTYQYWESNVSKEAPDFIMKGSINVIHREQHNTTHGSQDMEDIVGTLMVPAKFLDKYRSEFENNGFTIDSTYTYKDLRGGQRGTGPEQTLVVWKAHNVPLKIVISDLQELTSSLPYS
ncbi:MAG TPA: hypothetical protein VH481_04390 [Nitrososphaeraceae archaeon]|jgi:plastocyanin